MVVPEIHALAARGEEHLYQRHCAGQAPTQTLLMEMLHAKRKYVSNSTLPTFIYLPIVTLHTYIIYIKVYISITEL